MSCLSKLYNAILSSNAIFLDGPITWARIFFAPSRCSFGCCVNMSSLLCKSNNKCLVINSPYHLFIMFILRPFSYNIPYLSRYTTSYNCTSFTMLIWSYHWWFRYPFIMLPMREWVHCNPWYVSRYPCNYCIEKWSPHTKRGFSPFPPPHTKTQVDVVITRDNFRTLADVVIVDPTHPIWCSVFQWQQCM